MFPHPKRKKIILPSQWADKVIYFDIVKTIVSKKRICCSISTVKEKNELTTALQDIGLHVCESERLEQNLQTHRWEKILEINLSDEFHFPIECDEYVSLSVPTPVMNLEIIQFVKSNNFVDQ
jgi:hypothetical protein